MKDLFLSNSIKLITAYNEKYSKNDIEKMKYGLEGLYLTFTKLVIIFLIAALLGYLKEILIMLIFFNIIRYPAFGAHANKSSTCLILSIILILGLTYITINIEFNTITKALIGLLCFMAFLLFAPADTEKRPLTNKRKRRIRKIASCIVALIYILLILFINNTIISNLILTALIIESLMINPIMYKIMGIPYDNYKKIIKTFLF